MRATERSGGVRWRDGNEGPFHPRIDARSPTGSQTLQICISGTPQEAVRHPLALAEMARSPVQMAKG